MEKTNLIAAQGKALEWARIRKNLSREELASKLGVSSQQVWHMERGKSSLLSHIRSLKRILGRPYSFFIDPPVRFHDPKVFDSPPAAAEASRPAAGGPASEDAA